MTFTESTEIDHTWHGCEAKIFSPDVFEYLRNRSHMKWWLEDTPGGKFCWDINFKKSGHEGIWFQHHEDMVLFQLTWH